MADPGFYGGGDEVTLIENGAPRAPKGIWFIVQNITIFHNSYKVPHYIKHFMHSVD